MNYIIQKLISYPEKTYRLYNPKVNHASKKNVSELHNSKTNLIYIKEFQII